MAKLDKRWAWLSLPVVLVLAFMCCCGGGGLLYFLIPAGDKVVLTSNAPAGDVRLDITESRKGGTWTYDLAFVDRATNKVLGGSGPHLTAAKEVKWGAEWVAGTCFVSCTEGGTWIGTHTEGSQVWLSLGSK